MTLHDVGLIFTHWKRNPPLRALVMAIAVSLGMKPPDAKEEPKQYMTADEFARLMAMTGGRLE